MLRKATARTVVLVILGMLALYGGASWLFALIPAAILVWYADARAIFGQSRN